MKRYKHKILYSLFVLAFLVPTGCEEAFDKALDRADDSTQTLEGILAEAEGVKGMVSSAYMCLPWQRNYVWFTEVEEALSDNAYSSDFTEGAGVAAVQWYNGLLSPQNMCIRIGSGNPAATNPNRTSTTGGFWGFNWAGVRFCNNFITNYDNITAPVDDLPIAERVLLLDEMIALRAYFYAKLISYHGPLPFIDQVFPPDFSGWGELTRPSYQEITDRIVEELDGVIQRGNIPMRRNPNTNEIHRIPMSFVYGLKSRVLLYNASPLNNPTGDVAKYQAAATATIEAIAALEAEGFGLVPTLEQRNDIFTGDFTTAYNTLETIWLGRSIVGNVSNNNGMNGSQAVPKFKASTTFRAGACPTQEIVDCYELVGGEMIIDQYDPTHANPTFTQEAINAGYDDVNDPYANRDERFYYDIIFNGTDRMQPDEGFGVNAGQAPIEIFTYLGAPGTGTNGISLTGARNKTFTGYHFFKGSDEEGYGQTGAGSRSNLVYMRMAELYLNLAEAQCGAGNLTEAATALDRTRLRAGQPAIATVPGAQVGDAAWLMHRIRNERRVELVIEDHRFHDVRRWDIISNDQNNTVSGILPEGNPADGFTYKRYELLAPFDCHNERYKVLPIPLSDKINLPNIDQPDAWQ